MGGLAIALGFYAPLVGLFLYRNGVSDAFYASPLAAGCLGVGGLIILALGVYDDLHGANAWQKLAVQVVVATGATFCGYRVDLITTPFGSHLAMGPFAIPLTVIWIVGVINAMNLIDGLDGLASGVALFAVLTCFVVAFHQANVLMALCTAAMGGAVLGFLFFNFNPATIFMGDTGSMFLGFVLATTSIRASSKGSTAVAILVPLLALGLPIMDTALAMIRRLVWYRPVFSADRDHVHHRLLAMGFTHRRAVLFLYAVCGAFALAALGLTFANSREAALLLGVVLLIVIALVRLLGYINFSSGAMQKLVMTRKRNREMRSRLVELGDTLRQAERIEDVWNPVKAFATSIGAEEARLYIQERPDDSLKTYAWKGKTQPPGTLSSTRISLNQGGDDIGEIEFGWRPPVDRDAEIASEILAAHVSEALHRLLLVTSRAADKAASGQGGRIIPLPPRKQ
jgi:UDP-GlcNAc:undecaprenyl-phosphate GlcNAc-1-phosphate transferase